MPARATSSPQAPRWPSRISRKGPERGGVDAAADPRRPGAHVRSGVYRRTCSSPPDHKFVAISATITSTDNCDRSPVVTLVSITSNEPANNKEADIQDAGFGTDDRTFSLRAERDTDHGGTGRIYTVTYRVTDKRRKRDGQERDRHGASRQRRRLSPLRAGRPRC